MVNGFIEPFATDNQNKAASYRHDKHSHSTVYVICIRHNVKCQNPECQMWMWLLPVLPITVSSYRSLLCLQHKLHVELGIFLEFVSR